MGQLVPTKGGQGLMRGRGTLAVTCSFPGLLWEAGCRGSLSEVWEAAEASVKKQKDSVNISLGERCADREERLAGSPGCWEPVQEAGE